MASIREIPLVTIDGRPTSLAAYSDKVVMVVNVASKCGLTPQYERLEQLQKTYESRGFTVIGFPCNQFAGQEPGTAEEIVEFCSATYGVTFPLMEKTKVNGRDAHPLYKELKRTKDHLHVGGPVQWNFEKFLVMPEGMSGAPGATSGAAAGAGTEVIRIRPRTLPDDPKVIAAIERGLAYLERAA